MFNSGSAAGRKLLSSVSRQMSTKVTVLGAAGGIGQPLSMLLKLSPYVDELACYDIVGTPGVAADLSHVRFSLSICLSVDLYISNSIIDIACRSRQKPRLRATCLFRALGLQDPTKVWEKH